MLRGGPVFWQVRAVTRRSKIDAAATRRSEEKRRLAGGERSLRAPRGIHTRSLSGSVVAFEAFFRGSLRRQRALMLPASSRLFAPLLIGDRLFTRVRAARIRCRIRRESRGRSDSRGARRAGAVDRSCSPDSRSFHLESEAEPAAALSRALAARRLSYIAAAHGYTHVSRPTPIS